MGEKFDIKYLCLLLQTDNIVRYKVVFFEK